MLKLSYFMFIYIIYNKTAQGLIQLFEANIKQILFSKQVDARNSLKLSSYCFSQCFLIEGPVTVTIPDSMIVRDTVLLITYLA